MSEPKTKILFVQELFLNGDSRPARIILISNTPGQIIISIPDKSSYGTSARDVIVAVAETALSPEVVKEIEEVLDKCT
ncbi:MAG: hypothetical protein AAGJ95_10455 [Cyanobacteria bacterium J06554_11]